MTRAADQPGGLPLQDETFLQRWSRRKLAATRDTASEPTPPGLDPSPEPAASPVATCVASAQQSESAQQATSARNAASADLPAPLPPIESLTFDSDFRAFLQPHVAEDLKRQALKKLLHDPRFNVMDGLDVYIDDYSAPSPIAPDLARSLAQARYIFEPPPTRVNAAGHVEDIPAQEQDSPPAAVESDARSERQLEQQSVCETMAPASETIARTPAGPASDPDAEQETPMHPATDPNR